MADRPWHVDRELDEAAVRSTLAEQFPAVDSGRLEHLGSGWEFDAYRTSDDWVFRFPRRLEYSTGFDREARIHALVRPHLPRTVSIPRVELWGRPGVHFPYAFAGHRLLRGVRADDHVAPPSPTFAAEVAAVLASIHAIPESEGRETGLLPDPEGMEDWLEECLEDSVHLTGIARELDEAVAWLRRVEATPAEPGGPLRVVHNDLCPDHLLVSAGTGTLTGVLDWTDTALGDPALDFTVLVGWKGWSFVEAVLSVYSAPLDRAFRERLEFLARVTTLHWVRSAMLEESDVPKHIGWVANAFRRE